MAKTNTLRAVDHGEEGEPPRRYKGAESTDSSLRRKGIFLLPNVITTGALFQNFYAIIAAMNGDFYLLYWLSLLPCS
ncbi:MAG: hypothetical protein CM15mP120_27980 [Pseudomonadota bacterium]|nr:MAG: hypothetical protein CM15mP120_27980 [Pseudomonadota bacterium]